MEYEYTANHEEIISVSKESFNPNLYRELKKNEFNMKIHMPKDINKDEIHTMRIIYTPTDLNSNINYIFKDDEVAEVFCFPFFPYFNDSKHDIESIFVHLDNKTVVAPGKLVRKNKKDNILFSSYLTHQIKHIPFVLGTFKCIDCSQNMIRSKIYTPLEFNTEQEFKQDVCVLLQYLQDNYLKTVENIAIVFSHNNIQTVSQNTIFIPISLFPLNGIDQNIYIRIKLCELFSKMLFCNLGCTDFWLAVGVREYMKNAFMRELLGENEIHYKNKTDLEFVYKNDVCESSLINEPDKSIRNDDFIFYSVKFTKSYYFKMVKGRIFLQILENHLSRAFLERIMYNTWQRPETDTIDFIKTIKDVSGRDMTSFFDFYVYRPGIIECFITYEIDKKGKVDVYLKQKSTSRKVNANKKMFEDLKMKVYEQEGVFDHKIVNDTLTFQCHYRTKKRKAETKSVQKNESIMLEGTDNEEKTSVKENIEGNENTGQILFMRGDPGIEQLVKVTIEQPDYMFTEQLITEKNVYSQIDAILALRYKTCEESIQTLERVLNDSHVFYKVRLMILFTISQIKIEPKGNLHDSYKGGDTFEEKTYNHGFQRIIQYFVKKNCVPGSTIPKSNDFSSFTSYLIQKYLSNALSVSDPELTKKFNDRVITSKNIIIAFLLNIIKYNSYDDGYLYCSSKNEVFNQNFISNTNYLACIIDSLSLQISSKSGIDLNPIIYEFERRRVGDMVFPSYQNMITSSILKSTGRMCFYGVIELNINLIKELTKKGNFYSVREEAINILCTCYLDQSFDYLINLFWAEERYFKIFILHTLKSIFEVMHGDCSDNEEYAEVFNQLEMSNSNAKIKYMSHRKFKCLYEKQEIFYEILSKYFYDPLIMELVTDILYLLLDRVMKYSLDEKTVQIEKPTFVIQLVLNNVVFLYFPDKMRKDFVETKNRKQEDPPQIIKEEKRSPYLIRFNRYDVIELRYDEFINKYFINVHDFMKRNTQTIGLRNISTQHVKDQKGDDIILLEINDMNSNFLYHKKENVLFDRICKVLGYSIGGNLYEEFLISNTTKHLKRHKYFTRLGVNIKQEHNIHTYKESLHKQFTFYYATQKNGSQYYLNSKALENYLEQTLNELMLFEPVIGIDDNIYKHCVELMDDIDRLEGSVNFIEPVDHYELDIPNYIDIIRIPTDLGTIRNRLVTNKYFALEYFIHGIELVFINCMAFNEINSDLYIIAKTLLVSARKLILSKFLPGILGCDSSFSLDIPLDFTNYFILDHKIIHEKLNRFKDPELASQKIYTILINVREQKEAFQFTHKIPDPKKLIKKQISLNDMIVKAQQSSYISVGHVLADMNQLIKNIVILNGNTSWVVRVCRKVEHYFRKECFVAFGLRFISGKKENL